MRGSTDIQDGRLKAANCQRVQHSKVMYVMARLGHAKRLFRLVPFTRGMGKLLAGICHSNASMRKSTRDFPRIGLKLLNVIALERAPKNVINE